MCVLKSEILVIFVSSNWVQRHLCIIGFRHPRRKRKRIEVNLLCYSLVHLVVRRKQRQGEKSGKRLTKQPDHVGRKIQLRGGAVDRNGI